MPKKYTSEQFWKLYKNLPDELKDALFAEETGSNIHNACERNKVMEKLGDIVDLVGQVLVGVLAPDDFQITLEKDLKIKKEIAKKAAQEINRFIFYPVRGELEKLYQTKIAVPEKPTEVISIEKQPTEPGKGDAYRESIE